MHQKADAMVLSNNPMKTWTFQCRTYINILNIQWTAFRGQQFYFSPEYGH